MPPKMDILRHHVQDMLEQVIIRPSTSQYSSPIFLVPKGQGGFHPMVDYLALNKKIKTESVPLPDIHSCFHWFKSAKVFTSLDLNSAYHQIVLFERSKPLTAFVMDWNLYEYTRVPFGIATGAQVLTHLLDQVFSDVKFTCVFHYLDDLVMYNIIDYISKENLHAPVIGMTAIPGLLFADYLAFSSFTINSLQKTIDQVTKYCLESRS
jgi:hypothetical protein